MFFLSGTLGLLHLLAALAVCAHVLRYCQQQGAAVAWILAALFLPFIGPLAYLCLAIYQGPRSVRRRRKEARALRERAQDRGDPQDAYGGSLDSAGFPRLMEETCSFPLMRGNRVELIMENADAYERQLQAIRGAEREVLLQTYVMKKGGVVDDLWDALADRARSGVKVRLLADPIGSQALPDRVLREMKDDGIETATFLTPNPLKGRFQLNFRNHRKILLVDGKRGFTGGRNWADEYYEKYSGSDAFRDTTAEFTGPVVAGFRRIFQEDWAVAIEDDSGVEPVAYDGEDGGPQTARVLPFAKDEPTDDPVTVLTGAIRAARESVLVVTPYFVPGVVLNQSLATAARSGVRVELLVAARSLKRTIDLSARRAFDPLLDAGVKIHLRQGPLLHSKAVVVDDCWSLFGSLNFDTRSFQLNYELCLEVLGPEFAGQLRELFAADFERSRRVDPDEFARRGTFQRIAENAAALFSPLL